MNLDEASRMTKQFEGLSKDVYLCPEGVPTGGYGHAFYVGSPLPFVAINALFRQDFAIAIEDYEQLNLDLDGVRRAVIIDMLYNLGMDRFLGFKKMMRAVRIKDWEAASIELLDSKYARQTKTRAIKLAEMMRTGNELD